MADHTAIEWTDSTFNPWTGCTKVSPGCDHCYAESWSGRAGAKVGKWGPGAPRVRTTPANWRGPEKWNRTRFVECTACGWRGESSDTILLSTSCPVCPEAAPVKPARRRVFCASLADVFDNEVDREWRRDLFRLIAHTKNLDWLLLTKRIGNAAQMLQETAASFGFDWRTQPWEHVWLGATVVNQVEADRDIPKLLATPAAVRFLSMEPLLEAVTVFSIDGPIDVPDGTESPLHWVIVGGESGHQARPMHPDWARSLRDQCAAAGVPFLFKQHGEWLPVGKEPSEAQRLTFLHARPEARCYSWPDGETLVLAGKKAAGRLLDGRTHDGFPGVANG